METRPALFVQTPPSVPGFELGECIGRGATSEVWAAASEADGRRVAVKVVHADLADVDAAAREAALSAVTSSTHVVRVEACLPLGDGRVALVMPFLRGGSLGSLVRARGHLEPGEVVTLLAPVAAALAGLHGVGVVHGDVSPGNVLLDIDGRPHLADLGMVQVLGEVSPGVWGSDGYVAPEVVLGGGLTAAADVYSLGALGWLCLTGTVPGPPGLRPRLGEVALAESGPTLSALVAALERATDPEAEVRPDADALAWALFEAAEPVPIHLVRGEDDVSAITYRLRAAATGLHDPGPEVTAGTSGEGRWSRSTSRGALLALPTRARAAVRRGHRVPRGQPGAHRVERPGRRVTLALGALAGLMLSTMAVLGLGTASGAGQVGGGGASAGASPTGTPEATASVPGGDPRLDADAPATRARDLLTSLSDARAAAWRSGSPLLLREVDAPGSTIWSRDLAAVTELKRSGIRYVDLRHDVVAVSTVTASHDRAVLRATVDTSGFVVASRGSRKPRPATSGVPVLVDLVRTPEGWRVSDIRDAG